MTTLRAHAAHPAVAGRGSRLEGGCHTNHPKSISFQDVPRMYQSAQEWHRHTAALLLERPLQNFNTRPQGKQ
jgi:hypothetical protein